MKFLANKFKIVVAITATSMMLLSGCAINMQVPIKDPVPSNVTYNKSNTSTPITLSFKDDQPVADKAKILTGTIPMQMIYEGKPFDATPWVAQHTVKEMTARGLPVTLSSDTANNPNILIKRLHIENHRVNGFSPFVTFTSLRADVITPHGVQRVTAYIKRGKVPVWSFNEIIDPTYNTPLALVTKELAAKLNQQLFGQVVNDSQVQDLITNINKNGGIQDDAYLDVYQLGYSNNPIAIPELVKLSTHSNEYVRLAAISSLGIIKATDQFDLLKKLYETKTGLWQDRAMALKAIGDLNTPKSGDYLQKEWSQFQNRTDKEALWTKEILALYL